jgi:hypothetical protein
MKTLPQPWTVVTEATIFSGWIYDHLLPHATRSVAHPLMLRAIAAAKKKNDQIDASKIADRVGLRFPAGVPHDARGVPGSPPHPAVPAADGADEEPCLWDC